METGKLSGKVALVTGASRGIGRAIASGYAREGANVAVTGRTEEDLRSIVDQIDSFGSHSGSRALRITADLFEASAPSQVVARTLQAFGRIDILVNNAGIGSSSNPRPVVDFDDDFWDKTLLLNLTVPYKLSKAVLPQMLERNNGRIINIASINAKLPALHGAAYTASKHGLLGLTRTLALEVARNGVTVNAICPGPVRTEMNDRRLDYDAKRLGTSRAEIEARLTPIGRRLEAEEIVPMALLLASDESAAITGQAFNVCGGIAT